MIVILAIFGILIFFLLHKSNHMLRKGPLEITRICIQDLETITSMNMHANWLLEPPGPAQRVFFQRLFLHPPTPASRNSAQWVMQCIAGGWVLSQCERPLLAWSGPRKTITRVGTGHHVGPKLVPKFVKICNIIPLLVINTREYNFMTSNDSLPATITGFYVYWDISSVFHGRVPLNKKCALAHLTPHAPFCWWGASIDITHWLHNYSHIYILKIGREELVCLVHVHCARHGVNCFYITNLMT